MSLRETDCDPLQASRRGTLVLAALPVSSMITGMRRAGCLLLLLLCASTVLADAAAPHVAAEQAFPRALHTYDDAGAPNAWQTILQRARQEPFNVIATAIFFLAILHTFLAPRFMHLAHKWRDEHEAGLKKQPSGGGTRGRGPAEVSWKAELMHFLGEVEVVFGIWVVPLLIAIAVFREWPAAESYLSNSVNFTEPIFVVVVMTIASTRPILRFAEQMMQLFARIGGGTVAAWWLSILTLGPLLGSFITEPAAMTICALLLARQFYDTQPSKSLCYATLGLLFVNISVGGTLTHFAAPPVLMVASRWDWDIAYMFTRFGWKAVTGIVLANLIYFLYFRRELADLRKPMVENDLPANWSDRTDPVPIPVTAVHLFFLAWTVFTAHYPSLFVGGFLFFLASTAATEHHQNPISLRPAILVGFFLAGLVVHGGFQGWWIAPVLASMTEIPLMFSAMALTAFNDNAAITYLATLVPNFSEGMRYAVVAGAVAGGGLTVIANAPNPAGQSILSSYFGDGVSPLWLAAGALMPTAVMMMMFLLF